MGGLLLHHNGGTRDYLGQPGHPRVQHPRMAELHFPAGHPGWTENHDPEEQRERHRKAASQGRLDAGLSGGQQQAGRQDEGNVVKDHIQARTLQPITGPPEA